MSLSFVSKSIQTGRDDGGYDEKPVENVDDSGGSGPYTAAHKPLFEQLRANKEQEEEERAEFQRSIMRGTLALDDEDCAHLDSIAKQRMKEKSQQQQQTEEEVASFRAAKADLLEKDPKKPAEQEEETKSRLSVMPEKRAVSVLAPPLKIVVKKRRLRANRSEANDATRGSEQYVQSGLTLPQNSESAKTKPSTGLGGLLSGYGSSSEEDE